MASPVTGEDPESVFVMFPITFRFKEENQSTM